MQISNEDCRLPVFVRPDLQFAERSDGDPHHVVKDPVALKYFMLLREEAFILKMLDGSVSLAEIKRKYAHTFSPQTLCSNQILGFLSQSFRNGLLICNQAQQAEQLLNRNKSADRMHRLSRLLSPFVIRWRGINPDRLLERVYPSIQCMFRPSFLVACSLLILAASLLAMVRFHELRSRLPDFDALFFSHNTLLLVATFIAVKILHELGHAFTCKHFGGEVHELGIIFVAGLPLLYCNVSDAWMFRRRWQRIAVSGAGMFVELTIAAVATICWWFTEPGAINAICRNTMLVCSITTIIANANPLLRFDGYFILSDLIGIPNLWNRSRSVVYHHLAQLVLKASPFAERTLPTTRRGFLLAYGFFSMLYRVVVFCLLFWLARAFFSAYELDAFFPVVAAAAIVGILLGPATLLARMGRNPMFRQRINKQRLAFTGLAAAIGVATCFWLPLPFRVRSVATIEANGAAHAYVYSPGFLVGVTRVGTRVRTGDPIAKIANHELQRKIEDAKADVTIERTRIRAFAASQSTDEESRRALPTAREELNRLQKRLSELKAKADRLVIPAPADGVIMPFYAVQEQASDTHIDLRLRKWNGCVTDKENVGCYLETGTVCCSVGHPDRIEAVVLLDEFQVDFVRNGQKANLIVPGNTDPICGSVTAISRRGTRFDAKEIVSFNRRRTIRPVQTLYEARIRLEPSCTTPPIGVTAHAVIAASPRTIAERVLAKLTRLGKS